MLCEMKLRHLSSIVEILHGLGPIGVDRIQFKVGLCTAIKLVLRLMNNSKRGRFVDTVLLNANVLYHEAVVAKAIGVIDLKGKHDGASVALVTQC